MRGVEPLVGSVCVGIHSRATGYTSDLHYRQVQSILDLYSMHQTTGWGGFVGSLTTRSEVLRRTENPPARPVRSLSSGDLVRRLHAESGLTWDQIARLFGVSRRSVHMWANGGTLNADNHELLMKVAALVESLPGPDPQSRRLQLLSSNDGGVSKFEEMRTSRGRDAEPVNGPAFTPGELLGYSRE